MKPKSFVLGKIKRVDLKNLNILIIIEIIIMDAQSETLSVDNGGSSFLIFLFGDPHSLEG